MQAEGEFKKASTIRCGNVIDGISEQAIGPQTLTIHSGRFVSIIEAASETVVDLDLSDYTYLPGLINTHVHFDANPEDALDYGVYARRTQADNLALILRNAAITLQTGFTTVRHVGAWFPDTLAMAITQIDAGDSIGPRIQSAGPYLTIPGGGGDLTFPEIPAEKIPPESQQGVATTPEQFANKAKITSIMALISSKSLHRVLFSPQVATALEMNQDDIEAVVEVARNHGKRHVQGDQSGRDAILAGVDSLEHASSLR